MSVRMTPKKTGQLRFPYFSMIVSAGSSPSVSVHEQVEERVDLTDLLIKQPDSTFLIRVVGDSTLGSPVVPGDILIVNRATEPRNNDLVISIINGEFTLKTFLKPLLHLASANANGPIPETFDVWGVVLWVLHSTR